MCDDVQTAASYSALCAVITPHACRCPIMGAEHGGLNSNAACAPEHKPKLSTGGTGTE